MKKILFATNIIFVGILSTPLSLFAYNAALVASIHDDALTRVVTMADVAQVAYIKTYPTTPTFVGSSTKTFLVDGAFERLNQTAATVNGTQVSGEINSQEELEKYAKTVALDNSDIMLITVATDTISLTRVTPVKLFGVIQLSSPETVEVISWGDGTNAVQVTRPWWGMFSNDQADSQELSNNVYRRMKAISPLLFSPNLTAATKARIISEIQNAFNENIVSIKSPVY